MARKSFVKGKFILVIVILILIFPVNIYISNNCIETNVYTLKPDKLPKKFKGFTILQITDTHFKSTKDLDRDLVGIAEKKLAEQNKKIDCIVITGDLMDFGDSLNNKIVKYVSRMTKKYPVYFVAGNHEYTANIDEFEKGLLKVGVSVLENQSIKLVRGKSHIWMTGVSEPNNKNKEDPFKNIPLDDYDITLVHRPNKFTEIVRNGANLVLCGHVHAGQVRIPFLPVLYGNDQGFFPKYGYGFYTQPRPDYGKAVMYVSKGIGSTVHSNWPEILGVRFFNRPEISAFILE